MGGHETWVFLIRNVSSFDAGPMDEHLNPTASQNPTKSLDKKLLDSSSSSASAYSKSINVNSNKWFIIGCHSSTASYLCTFLFASRISALVGSFHLFHSHLAQAVSSYAVQATGRHSP